MSIVRPDTNTLGKLCTALCLAAVIFAAQSGAAQESAEGFDQPRSRIVEGHGGVPLVVQEWGNPDGIPVLLLHGFSFGAAAFKHQIGDIATQLHLVAPDLRGHGLSGKPFAPEAYAGYEIWAEDIDRVIRAFALEKPVIVGWSFGGYVAMNYLRRCGPDCASGLLLAGSLAGIVERPPPPDPTKIGLPPMRGNARADNYHELFENAAWTARVMTYEEPDPASMLQKQLMVVMMPPHVRRAMGPGLALDNRDIAADMTLPILFVHGEFDSSVPGSSIDAALAAVPRGRAIVVPNSGHSPFEEDPELFNRTLLDFARSVYGPAR